MAAGCAQQVTTDQIDDVRERLRPSASDREIADFIESCLHDQAVTAFTRTPDGGWEGANVTEMELQILQDCMAAAEERYPLPPAPRSRAEFEVFYALLVREAECLASEGYPVEVPSLETYIDSSGAWSPYADLPMTPNWANLNELCPQDPWHYDE
jgi:hypothetical protein